MKYKVKKAQIKKKKSKASSPFYRRVTGSRLMEQEPVIPTLKFHAPPLSSEKVPDGRRQPPQEKRGRKWPKVLAVPGLLGCR